VTKSLGQALEPQDGNPTAGFDLSKLRDVDVGEIAIRFAFGAGVSVVASVVSTMAGPFWGGTFLAFPAILPASLTLLERKEGTEAALHTQRGALLGSIGMVAFAVVAALTFDQVPTALVLISAAVAWSVAAVGLYLSVASWRHRHRGRRDDRKPSPPPTSPSR
jgi:hypothetical protein